jgi:hypothetical protein
MKNLLLVAFILIGMIGMAQSDYTHSLTTKDDASGHFWDYSDTTTDGETLDMLIRLRSPNPLNLRFQILGDEITGSATQTATLLGSNDGVTYIDTGDSITAALTADGSIWVYATGFNYSYAKLLMTTTGTETSTFKCYYSIRKE